MKSTKPFLFGGILLAVVLGAVFFYWQLQHAPQTYTPSTATTSAAATVDIGGGVKVPTNGEGVSVLPIENPNAKPPSLNGSITVSASLDPEVAAEVKTKIENMVAQLKQDPSQLKLWLTLGSYRKMAGDYEGARDAWEYVAAAAPSSFVAFNNLGDLYMNFLKNYPKAELNYRKVIAVRPDYIDTYRNLYTLYHYLYKTNTTAAADILKEGLKNNPNNPDLLAIQAQMKSGK